MNDPRVTRIEWARLEGRRPRTAGCNARLGEHGITIRPSIARLTTDDGATGFGACHVTPEQAKMLLGQPLDAVFSTETGVLEPWRAFEYPLWDLVGRRTGQPVYAMAAAVNGAVTE